MKKLSFLTMAILTAWALQACNGTTNNDSTKLADSVNTVKDTTARLGTGVEKVDAAFAVEAASGGMTEVILGKLAQQKGQDKRVKNFGAMMISDHIKINNEMKALAATEKITLPQAPGASEQKVINELSKKQGKDFDKAYIKDMIEDHRNDIKVFEDASKNCADPNVKAFAVKVIPMLHTHLDAVITIGESMK